MSLRTLLLVARSLNCRFIGSRRWNSGSSGRIPDGEEPQRKVEDVAVDESALPPEPSFCCMSGCPNCVWIKYAQELTQLFDNGDVIAKKKIKEKVSDPKLRAFLFKQLGIEEGEGEK